MAAGSYNVQDCNVSTDHTSILVECTFAINSTAPGIVVIQDDQSQYTINKTLQRLQQDSDKGSVNITGLPAGEYSVRVYDNMEDYDNEDFAYEHSQLLHIMSFTRPSLVSVSSTIIHISSEHMQVNFSIENKSLIMLLYAVTDDSSPVQTTPSQHENINNTVIILASSITTGLLLLLVILFVVITSLVCAAVAMRKQHKGIL